MDPELLQSIADQNGMPVEHFDGYSVVDHPDHGPITIPHPPASMLSDAPTTRPSSGAPTPVVTRPSSGGATPITTRDLPAREGVPPMLARPPAPAAVVPPALTPEMQRTRDTMRAAQREQLDRDVVAESQRELAQIEAESGYHVSDPDQYGIQTRTYPDGRIVRVADSPAAFTRRDADRLRTQPTHAGVLTMPDGRTVTTDAAGRTVPDPGVMSTDIPAEWLAGDAAQEQRLRQSAEHMQGVDASMRTPAPVSAASVPQQVDASAPPTPQASGAVEPVVGVPQAIARPVASGRPVRAGGARAAAPIASASGVALPPAASDTTIASLAQGSAGPRREADLVDRQMLHDQQVAAAGREDAIRQMGAEREIERQRQADEADRQQAMVGARHAYQNAVDRVASARIEPTRWFRDQGVGGTIAATLAVALGAVGQAFGGTNTNLALDEINRAVDRDMQAQQSEIDAGRAAADLQGNMLSITRQEYADRDAAREAARAALLRQVALQTQAHAADLSDDEARLHADELHQQLLAQADEADRAAITQELEWRRQAATIARTEAEAAIAQRRAMHVGGGTRPQSVHISTPEWEAFNHAMGATGGDVQRAAQLSFPPEAITPELLTQLESAGSASSDQNRAALDALDASLSQLERVSGEGEDIPGVGLWDHTLPGSEGMRVQQEVENAADLLGRLRSGAAVSEDEYNRFIHILGASRFQTEDQFRAGLGILRRELAARLHHTAGGDDAAARDLASLGGAAQWVDE